jgi:hypothetical protein
LGADSITYSISSSIASTKPIGAFNPTPSYCSVAYSLIWAVNNTVITTMSVFSISGGNLIVGVSSDTTLIPASPYSIKV